MAIDIDSDCAEAYFSRGTMKLNNLQFDDAINDFDHALAIEPFMAVALANRAFTRIRKYELGGGRKISENSYVTVLATKNDVSIPKEDQEKICADLHKAMFLGDKSKMIVEALSKHCK